MAVKIRLQRRGRTHRPFYSIVVADSRSPRDGRFIEKLGTYNPTTNPASIDLNFDRALYWIQVGAQPTDTVRAILSYKGVLLMNHLLKGVKKGAFSEEEAKKRFEAWKAEKEAKIRAKREKILAKEKEEANKRLEAERKIKEEREKQLAEKYAKKAAEEAEEAGDNDTAAQD